MRYSNYSSGGKHYFSSNPNGNSSPECCCEWDDSSVSDIRLPTSAACTRQCSIPAPDAYAGYETLRFERILSPDPTVATDLQATSAGAVYQ